MIAGSGEPFVKIFERDETPFGASYAAQRWLEANGYSVGSSSVDGPRGVVKGVAYISKWRNMTPKERSQMDGYLDAGRNQPARLVLKVAPDCEVMG